MTEYDYSPAAIEQYMATQDRIRRWADNAHEHESQFRSPFDGRQRKKASQDIHHAPTISPANRSPPASPSVVHSRPLPPTPLQLAAQAPQQYVMQSPVLHVPPLSAQYPQMPLASKSHNRPPPLNLPAFSCSTCTSESESDCSCNDRRPRVISPRMLPLPMSPTYLVPSPGYMQRMGKRGAHPNMQIRIEPLRSLPGSATPLPLGSFAPFALGSPAFVQPMIGTPPGSPGMIQPMSPGIMLPVSPGMVPPSSAGMRQPFSAGMALPMSAGTMRVVSPGMVQPLSAGVMQPMLSPMGGVISPRRATMMHC